MAKAGCLSSSPITGSNPVRSTMIRILSSGKFLRDGKEINVLYPYLDEEVQVEKVTFGTLFEHLLKYSEEYNLIFSSALGHCRLEEFEEDFQKSSEASEGETLVLSWVAEIHPEIDNELCIYVDVYSRREGDQNRYAVDFCSLGSIRNLFIELDRSFSILEWWKEGYKQIPFGNRSFSVYDMLYALLYEISFYGAPSDREEQLQKLIEIKEEFDKRGV